MSAGLAFMPFGPAPALAADPSTSPVVAESDAPDPAPSVDPTGSPLPASDPTPSGSDGSSSGAGSTSDAAPPTAIVDPAAEHGVVVRSITFVRVDPLETDPAAGTPIETIGRYEPIRVRVLLENADPAPAVFRPLLQVRIPGLAAFAPVPVGAAGPADPFHLVADWLPVAGGGTLPGPDPSDLLAPVELEPASTALLEVTLEATSAAAYRTSYGIRLVDGAATDGAGPVAALRLGAAPAPLVGTVQRTGVPVDAAAAAAIAAARAAAATETQTDGALVSYRLVLPDPALRLAVETPASGVHGPYPLGSDACAACHSAHRAAGPAISVLPSQYGTCTVCHDGDVAGGNDVAGATNVVDDWTGLPANSEGTRSYYSHPLSAPGHTLAESDPLAGRLNRHADCADCHQPHRANGTDGTAGVDPSTGGAAWLTPGRLEGATGVQVTNGAGGTAPQYRLRDAEPETPEYEICLKCHSGYTQQLANDPAHPSRDREDLGLVLNPRTASYHPLESAGTNATAAITNSLLGSSPYKLWTYAVTSVVRCENCHATGGLTPSSAAASLPTHGSAERGILLRPYRDRVLTNALTAYSSGDFALCYLCHAEAPFADVSGEVRSDTNFRYHGLHVAGLQEKGAGGLDLDTAGAGQGNAICAECHIRIHGTASAPGVDDTANSRLVAFAPNVGSNGGSRAWTIVADGTSGTCTLTCHGAPHAATGYDRTSAAPYPVTLAISSSPATISGTTTTLTLTYTLENASAAPVDAGAFLVSPTIGGAPGETCMTVAATLAPGDRTTCTTSWSVSSGDRSDGAVVRASATDTVHLTNAALLVVAPDGAASSSGGSEGIEGAIASILFGLLPRGDLSAGLPRLGSVDMDGNCPPLPQRRSTVRGARRRHRAVGA